MSKRAFEKIAAGLSDAIGFAEASADPSDFHVHVPPQVDVKAIRGKVRSFSAGVTPPP